MIINFSEQIKRHAQRNIHCRQPFWILAAILDSGRGRTCVPRVFEDWNSLSILKISCFYHQQNYSGNILDIPIALFVFLAAILEFGSHVVFFLTLFNIFRFPVHYLIPSDMNISFIEQMKPHAQRNIHCRQPFYLLAAILDSGKGRTCVPRFFWSYMYGLSILKISCWYHQLKYSGTTLLHYNNWCYLKST